MHATRIDIDGPSYRQHVAPEPAGPAGKPHARRARRHDPVDEHREEHHEDRAQGSDSPSADARTLPDLEVGPDLVAIILLECALDVVRQALLAEHPSLVGDFRRPEADGPVFSLANTVCLRAPALLDTLRRYRRAVRLARPSTQRDDDAHDITF